jgi:predicted glutamine amidotransferase
MVVVSKATPVSGGADMCELFAMSTRLPSTVSLSLEEFSSHGGLKGPHKDGWGIAWYEAGEVHLTKESLAASTSLGLKSAMEHPFLSDLVLCHIRKATQGTIASRNCQPFIRELGGAWHSFAHNGDLPGIRDANAQQQRFFQPVGETDSELAFCDLLERLRRLWKADRLPTVSARLEVIQEFATTLRQLGPANFLYTDGEVLFAHSHKRHQTDGTIRAPGLWQLKRHCKEGGFFDAEGLSLAVEGKEQDVVLFASVPLTPENWTPVAEGAVVAVQNGQVLAC